MSRIGKKPVEIPQGVEVEVEGTFVKVKGPKGELSFKFHPDAIIEKQDGKIVVKRKSNRPFHRALHGTVRAIIANMIEGVTKGFKKELKVVGLGYRAQLQGNTLVLNVGYSHPVEYKPPDGIKIEVPDPTSIIISGIDKQKVGQVAAEIRAIRPPEPYKGKGIRYADEQIIRKAGKAGKK